MCGAKKNEEIKSAASNLSSEIDQTTQALASMIIWFWMIV